ncbi:MULTISPECIES: hypothetical protein [unclassified Saccharopolyspora]|uniref:hypothetical protein n=1 Tax=unclassified Saccharopolyspora TaxID=2646250 RepID=UPI001CD3F907|nr:MULTISPECIES: hypothetical protein [unclassified Saccharopolyspora]MCA1185792.1 hypothetical protein [Saccharopolyspora sp. 6T]MCA1191704.1 hypothetical protein [Saccharopolyspora sp. 6V]
MTERVECDDCGKKVNVRKDDTVAEHHWAYRGVRQRCDASGKRYSRHAGTFHCVGRTGARQWVIECRCGESWLLDANENKPFEEVERPWREHCEQVKGGAAA